MEEGDVPSFEEKINSLIFEDILSKQSNDPATVHLQGIQTLKELRLLTDALELILLIKPDMVTTDLYRRSAWALSLMNLFTLMKKESTQFFVAKNKVEIVEQ